MTDLRARSKRASITNGGIAAVLLVVLAVTALFVQPPTPPSIAEFAPQSQQQIDEAPDEQTADGAAVVGGGEREVIVEEVDGEVAAEPATVAVNVEQGVPSALACVAWPDGSVTQTFDPQSPPCIASWPLEAGNGGSTWRGVTDTEIRLAVPVTSEGQADLLAPLIEHFNDNYQFYGRRLVVQEVLVSDLSPVGNRDPVVQRANAQSVVEVAPFAALEQVDPADASRGIYLGTLADNGVIGLTGARYGPFLYEAQLEAWAPFVYSFLAPSEVLLAAMGRATCQQLVGKPASHSPQFATTPRVFAVLKPAAASTGGSDVPGVQRLLDELAACGVDSPQIVEYDDRGETADPAQKAIYTQLRLDGVTTLLYIQYDMFDWRAGPLFQASGAGYQPEWFVATGAKDDDFSLQFAPPEQASNVFGVLSDNKQLAEAERFEVRATQLGPSRRRRTAYKPLLVLASGIQAAGPDLTPETLSKALATLAFPNPGAGAAPFFQATASVDHVTYFARDFTSVWYSPAEDHTLFHSPGAWCYVDRGARWTADAVPAQDTYFDRTVPCR